MSFTLETGILALSGVFLTPSPNASPVGIIMTKLGEVLIAWIRPVSQKHHEEVYCEYRFPNGRDNGFEGGFGEPIMNVSALYRDRTYRNFESNYEELSGVFGLMDEQRIKVILLIKFPPRVLTFLLFFVFCLQYAYCRHTFFVKFFPLAVTLFKLFKQHFTMIYRVIYKLWGVFVVSPKRILQ